MEIFILLVVLFRFGYPNHFKFELWYDSLMLKKEEDKSRYKQDKSISKLSLLHATLCSDNQILFSSTDALCFFYREIYFELLLDLLVLSGI